VIGSAGTVTGSWDWVCGGFSDDCHWKLLAMHPRIEYSQDFGIETY
jgi:hypothetical protein